MARQAVLLKDDLLDPVDPLLDDPTLVHLVRQCLATLSPLSRRTGREGIAPDRLLRCCVMKHLKGWSFRDLERELRSNLVYRRFTHFDAEATPDMNFIERRSSVPGGCPVQNTAIEADDGHPLLRDRARAAWHQWRDALAKIVAAGLKREEIRPDVDPKAVATLIISSLEGALMIARLERNKEALLTAQSHLERYLEVQVRVPGRSH